MNKEWEIKKLGDISEIIYGYTEKASFKEIGPKFLRITDIQNNNVDWESVPFCSANGSDYQKYKLNDGDIVFARTGATTGKSYLIKNSPKSVFASYLIKVHLNNGDLLPEFLYLYFQTNKYWETINSGIAGSAQGGFNATKLSQMRIPIPPIPEQKRIVKILDEAFAAIDKAKANAEKNLQNSQELFDSYLESIDADKHPLGSLVNISTGKLNANAAAEHGKYPFFTCSRDIYAINDYAFDCEAILLAGNNASGDFNVKHYKGKFNAYQRTYVITVNNNHILYRFLYFQLLKGLREFKEKSLGVGTKFLKLGMIQELQISLPSIEEQVEIVSNLDALLSQTDKLKNNYSDKLGKLEELKKSILQKAFEGELTIENG